MISNQVLQVAGAATLKSSDSLERGLSLDYSKTDKNLESMVLKPSSTQIDQQKTS